MKGKKESSLPMLVLLTIISMGAILLVVFLLFS